MKTKPMIKDYVSIKKLYNTLVLSLSRAIQFSFFLLCFSISLNISSVSKSKIEFFTSVFAEKATASKEQVAKAVWKIEVGGSSGSGFFISENKIITNYHVIDDVEFTGLESIRIVQEGSSKQFKVKRITALSLLDDLALLEIEGAISNFLSLPSGDLDVSKNLYALGYARGRFREIRQTGVLKDESFFADYSNPKGVSGGPILNELYQLFRSVVSSTKKPHIFYKYSNIKIFYRVRTFFM